MMNQINDNNDGVIVNDSADTFQKLESLVERLERVVSAKHILSAETPLESVEELDQWRELAESFRSIMTKTLAYVSRDVQKHLLTFPEWVSVNQISSLLEEREQLRDDIEDGNENDTGR
jgi:cell division FtsZ-interacting protein ZapD